MCLITKQAEAKIAKTNIHVYKLVELKWSDKEKAFIPRAIFLNYIYSIKNRSKFGISKRYMDNDGKMVFNIHQGLHAFFSITRVLELFKDNLPYQILKDEDGVLELFKDNLPYQILKDEDGILSGIFIMVIPKGSKYYISLDGKEIVSNRMNFERLATLYEYNKPFEHVTKLPIKWKKRFLSLQSSLVS